MTSGNGRHFIEIIRGVFCTAAATTTSNTILNTIQIPKYPNEPYLFSAEGCPLNSIHQNNL